MWGLSPYDDNEQINAYKQSNNITNPCAGTEGGGPQAIARVIDGQTFYGYPSYCVVCPDKKLNFGVCLPPTVECFDGFITDCIPTSVEETAQTEPEMGIFPNPAGEWVTISASVKGNVSIEIIDLLGSVKKQTTLEAFGQLDQAMYVGDLPQGLYLVTLNAGDQRLVKKLNIR
ncbi:MAG: T9SS type A sorting domain-containing protein [Bacteroidales bacterium]